MTRKRDASETIPKGFMATVVTLEFSHRGGTHEETRDFVHETYIIKQPNKNVNGKWAMFSAINKKTFMPTNVFFLFFCFVA